MGCGGQDLRHLGSGFELGAILKRKPSLAVPPFRGRARRGAVCSPLIVSRRPRAVGSSPREPGLWSSRRLPREHGIRGHDVGSPPDFFVVERILGIFLLWQAAASFPFTSISCVHSSAITVCIAV